ncbi:MAG: DNA-binding response regulator [Flavobacterium sp.]|nr:MAG: DNA-binding response regulator [Flavobacterium sp.]
MSSIQSIIIDDEELARTLLKTYVDRVSYLNCKGSFEDPMEALDFIRQNKVDLIFLDIQMPELKGTEFAEIISNTAVRIIFTTAYSEYALQGFELNALDYLVKPITFQRFLSAVEKFPLPESKEDTIVIKSGYDLHKVKLKDIIYIESESEYVNYFLENGKNILANQSLAKLEETLPKLFIRVHRSYIVNRDKVTGLKSRNLLLSGHSIPVSDSYFTMVKKDLF